MAALCGAGEGGAPFPWVETHGNPDVCPNGHKPSDMKRYALIVRKPQMSRGMP